MAMKNEELYPHCEYWKRSKFNTGKIKALPLSRRKDFVLQRSFMTAKILADNGTKVWEYAPIIVQMCGNPECSRGSHLKEVVSDDAA